jgi:hypothetical protein
VPLLYVSSPVIMRLFLIAFVLLFQQPNPIAQTRVGEPKAYQVTGKEQQNVHSPSPVVSIRECLGCFQESIPAHRAEKENSYDPRNDALYRWYLRATIIGVAVALVGLAIIFVQTLHTGKQVSALMNAERAYVVLEGAIKLKKEFPYPSFYYTLLNVGKTPAIVIETYGALQVGKRSDSSPPDSSIYHRDNVEHPLLVPFPIPAEKPHPQSHSSGREIGDEERKGIFTPPHDLCFWACGFYIYLDVFGREYEQRFCYRYLVLDQAGFFCADGPEEYRQRFERSKRTYFPTRKQQQ